MTDERRQSARTSFEPMRVRVYGTREGILVDLSTGGALVLFPADLPVGRDIELLIEWDRRVVKVPARVKRCLSHQVRLEAATLARTEYDVAVEFVDVPPEVAAAIQEILKTNPPA